METRTSVKGILHNRSGQPIKDAIVMIAQGPGSHHDIASVTNDSGEFYLSDVVVPGQYTLQIRTASDSFQQEVNLTGSQVIHIRH